MAADEDRYEIDQYGAQRWYRNNHLHRDDDLPAVVLPDDTQYWMQCGKRHRDNDQPAVVTALGTCKWFVHGSEEFPEAEGFWTGPHGCRVSNRYSWCTAADGVNRHYPNGMSSQVMSHAPRRSPADWLAFYTNVDEEGNHIYDPSARRRWHT